MPYLSDEIDEGATRRRIEEITASGLHALEQCAERSEEIDKQGRESIARQEAEIKAMEEARDAAKAAKAEAGDEDKQPPPSPWLQRREAKPTVLSFDGEEFAGDAPATAPIPAAGTLPPPDAPLPVPLPPDPPTPPAGERVNVMSLGYDDEEEPGRDGPNRPTPPAARRADHRPAPDEDDDMSGRSWLQ